MKLDAAVRAFLDAPRVAVLGTLNLDGSPQLSVIWYERRGDEVVVNTTAPRVKARNMTRDPRASRRLLTPSASPFISYAPTRGAMVLK